MAILLPPKVSTPLSECSEKVQIKGAVPGATVIVFSGKEIVAEGVSFFPEISLTLTVALEPGQKIVAIQTLDGNESEPSPEPVIVQAKPTSLGPIVFDSTIYGCGSCVAVSGAIPGVTVEIHAANGDDAGLRGRNIVGDGSARVPITPPAKAGEIFIGRQLACGEFGINTPMQAVLDPGIFQIGEFSAPSIEEPLYACQQFVRITGVFPGATVELIRSKAGNVQACFPFHTGTFKGIQQLMEGESVKARQILKRCHKISGHSKAVKVKSLETLPAPVIIGGLALCEGTHSITITNLIPGAIVRIYVDDKEIGIAGAPLDRYFAFAVPKLDGAEVSAQQGLCDNWSSLSDSVKVSHKKDDLSTPAIQEPLYECAGIVRVNAAKGTWVTVLSKLLGAPIGEGFALTSDRADILVSPLLIKNDTITAITKACGDKSKVSKHVGVKKVPKVRAPRIVQNVFTHATSVKVGDIIPGAFVEIFVSGFWRGGKYAADKTDTIPITGELVIGDSVSATQRICTHVSSFSANEDVIDPPPVAAFTAKPASGDAPLKVTFTNHSTGVITGYKWFFNLKDGDEDSPPDSIEKNPAHIYTDQGSYIVRLIVQGPVFWNLVEHKIEVSSPMPEPEPVGVASVILYNCHNNQITLSIWVWDQTEGSGWEQVGSLESQWNEKGGCPDVGDPFTINLEDDHIYLFRAVEVTNDCGDDPNIVHCIRWESGPFLGLKKGSNISFVIS